MRRYWYVFPIAAVGVIVALILCWYYGLFAAWFKPPKREPPPKEPAKQVEQIPYHVDLNYKVGNVREYEDINGEKTYMVRLLLKVDSIRDKQGPQEDLPLDLKLTSGEFRDLSSLLWRDDLKIVGRVTAEYKELSGNMSYISRLYTDDVEDILFSGSFKGKKNQKGIAQWEKLNKKILLNRQQKAIFDNLQSGLEESNRLEKRIEEVLKKLNRSLDNGS